MLKSPVKPYRPFLPDRKAPCLCGSMKRFGKCCAKRIPNRQVGRVWQADANAERRLAALLHVRADITQYRIWHLSHTVPLDVPHPIYSRDQLMLVDVNALNAHLENLMWLYGRLGWLNRLPALLDDIESAIDDPRWRAKLAYQRGIVALWQGDRVAAAEKIAGLDITPACEDVDLLQIHVDLHGNAMGLSEHLDFYDAIVSRTRSLADKLQYRGAYAFQLLMAGDDTGAAARFEAAIAVGRAAEAEKPFSVNAIIWFCKVLEGRGVIDHDRAFLDEAVTRLVPLADDKEQLTASGRAIVGRQLGDALRYAERYQEAIEAYRRAFEEGPDQALRTFEAECELYLGNTDQAYALIRRVAVTKLEVPERADHAFTFFYIALARRDPEALSDARDLLKAAVTSELYFERLRLQHIVTIQEALDDIASEREPAAVAPLLQGLKALSRYVQLQPNIAGIGLNLNNMIDDLVARHEAANAISASDELGGS
ncbi:MULTISPECIES: hypothetical protein [Sphingobium]|jgi:tetratricopeptide (TPR) repeat protein|uniref:hypothetical protein n=1 Tax=Sphingobium TaxID=165695 RepID=UPI0011AE836E|nr:MULTISPECIES: hypothetical protein [Sphingobium]KAA9011619.1 hypothetical protein F4U94_20110 [Sphingobium limneticum]